jgi:hypothetical protein
MLLQQRTNTTKPIVPIPDKTHYRQLAGWPQGQVTYKNAGLFGNPKSPGKAS